MTARKATLIGASTATLAIAAGLATTAAAQTAPTGDSPVSLEEIVVTAERRVQNIQDVPIAVTAITPKQIEDFGIVTKQDIQMATPGLTFDAGYGFSQPYIRGIGTNQPNPGLESAVASYVNGAYMVRSYGQIDHLFDMAGVEVLKGAQGTLWGRNATGGAILYTTAEPVLGEVSADVTAEVGNYQHALGELVLNIPLSDTFAIRLGGQAIYDHGYITNIVNGSKWGGASNLLGRVSLKWVPTDDFTASFMYEYNDDERRTNTFAERAPAPLCGSCALPGGGFNPVSGFYEIAYGPTATPTTAEGELMILRLALGGRLVDLSSVSSYRRDNTSGNINVAGSSNAFQDFFASSGGRTWAQELQANTKFDGMLNGMVGLSYSKDQSYNDNRIAGFIVANIPGIASDNTVTTHSYSAFGEVYFTPIDRVRITAGLRYTDDRRRYLGKLSPAAAAVFAPGSTALTFSNKKSFSTFTPRVVVAYDLDVVNLYASYNRGFKQGGYNTPSFSNAGPVNPEKVDYYEVGAKYVSDDRRLRINAAAFYYKYKDIQVSIVNVASGANVLENAAAARAYGFELGGSWAANEWLDVFADAAVLDTEFTSYPNASVTVINPTGIVSGVQNLKGTRLPRAPSFTASVGANVHVPVADRWTANFNAIGRYTSSYDFYPGANGPQRYARQDGYLLVNLSGYLEREVDWSDGGGFSPRYYRIGFFVNNATDKKYYTLRVAQPFIGLLDVAAPPRTYGLRLSAGF